MDTVTAGSETVFSFACFIESIRKFSETGIMSYKKKVWYGVRPKCEVSELIVAPVDIAHFSSALYILVAGILASTIIFVLEVSSNHWGKHAMLLKLRS